MDSHIRSCKRFLYRFVVLLIFGFITLGKSDLPDRSEVLNWCMKIGKYYPEPTETGDHLRAMEKILPDNVYIYSIGNTTNVHDILVIKFAKNAKDRPLGKPIIKFVANIRGDEVVGRSMVLLLACDIFQAYLNKEKEKLYTFHTVDIHLLPSANPDGFREFLTNAKTADCKTSWKPEKDFINMEECEKQSVETCIITGRCNQDGREINKDFRIKVKTQFPDLPEYIWHPDHDEKAHYYEIWNNGSAQLSETVAVRDWIRSKENPFILSVAYEAGPPVIRIPFDSVAPYISFVPNYKSYNHGAYSRTPDDEIFQVLASIYARNSDLKKGDKDKELAKDRDKPDCSCIRQKTELDYKYGKCTNVKTLELSCTEGMNISKYTPPEKPYFCNEFHEIDTDEIIINGAYWRNAYGSMQDYNYIYSNCFEFTVHTGVCKYPDPSTIKQTYLDYHQQSVLKMIEALSHHMVFGVVSEIDKDTKLKVPVHNATIFIDGNDKKIEANLRGEYWRLLNAGPYVMTVRHSNKNITESCYERRKITISRTIARREDFLLNCPQ